MVRVNAPGVFRTFKRLADGTRRDYWYHRATGMRLHGAPGSPEFISDFAAAEKLGMDRLRGTFAGLVRKWTLSPEFGKLAEVTKSDYRRFITFAEHEFGDMPIGALEDPRVRMDFLGWRAKVAEASGDRGADYRLSTISSMLSWARDNGEVSVNHLSGFKKLYHSDRADKLWLPEHIDAFMKVASVELQQAMILALHTGQRQGDLLRLAWPNYDGTAITLRQSKRKRHGETAPLVPVPCTKTLKRMLDGMDRAGVLILSTQTGLPWKRRYFERRWQEATEAAGINGLHFHDLRGTAVTMLAEAGCEIPEIAAITGHSLRTVHTILEKYLARTRHLADNAIVKFENAKGSKFANQMQTRRPSTGGQKAK